MKRPSDDPRWEEINPAWKYVDGEYGIHENVTVAKESYEYGYPQWVLRASIFAVGSTIVHHVYETYPDPFLASEAKSEVEKWAYSASWTTDQVRPGRLPQ